MDPLFVGLLGIGAVGLAFARAAIQAQAIL
jgi:hypothetical protein